MSGSALTAQLAALGASAHPDLRLTWRAIGPDDEASLTREEAAMLAGSVPKVRRASAAARIAAHGLLRDVGCAPAAILRDGDGVPIWPAGVVGSLAHDAEIAVAAIAPSASLESVGIDVEPAEPLPARLLDVVAGARERAWLGGDRLAGRLLFCAKEAVYKAAFPLDRVFLDFHDVEVRPDLAQAVTKTGRVVRVLASSGARLVAVTLVPR